MEELHRDRVIENGNEQSKNEVATMNLVLLNGTTDMDPAQVKGW